MSNICKLIVSMEDNIHRLESIHKNVKSELIGMGFKFEYDVETALIQEVRVPLAPLKVPPPEDEQDEDEEPGNVHLFDAVAQWVRFIIWGLQPVD